MFPVSAWINHQSFLSTGILRMTRIWSWYTCVSAFPWRTCFSSWVSPERKIRYQTPCLSSLVHSLHTLRLFHYRNLIWWLKWDKHLWLIPVLIIKYHFPCLLIIWLIFSHQLIIFSLIPKNIQLIFKECLSQHIYRYECTIWWFFLDEMKHTITVNFILIKFST